MDVDCSKQFPRGRPARRWACCTRSSRGMQGEMDSKVFPNEKSRLCDHSLLGSHCEGKKRNSLLASCVEGGTCTCSTWSRILEVLPLVETVIFTLDAYNWLWLSRACSWAGRLARIIGGIVKRATPWRAENVLCKEWWFIRNISFVTFENIECHRHAFCHYIYVSISLSNAYDTYHEL